MGIETPSGLFPAGPPAPPRPPAYREPHPVRAGAACLGLVAGSAWMLLFALLGADLPGHIWWLLVGGVTGWLAALVLARYGDRGAAVGVCLAAGAGLTAAAGLVALYWIVTGEFPLR